MSVEQEQNVNSHNYYCINRIFHWKSQGSSISNDRKYDQKVQISHWRSESSTQVAPWQYWRLRGWNMDKHFERHDTGQRKNCQRIYDWTRSNIPEKVTSKQRHSIYWTNDKGWFHTKRWIDHISYSIPPRPI